jgi:hypothetical protein
MFYLKFSNVYNFTLFSFILMIVCGIIESVISESIKLELNRRLMMNYIENNRKQTIEDLIRGKQ